MLSNQNDWHQHLNIDVDEALWVHEEFCDEHEHTAGDKHKVGGVGQRMAGPAARSVQERGIGSNSEQERCNQLRRGGRSAGKGFCNSADGCIYSVYFGGVFQVGKPFNGGWV